MEKKNTVNFFVLIILSICLSCSSFEKSSKNPSKLDKSKLQVEMASPPVIVFKTKNDYFDKVPVILSDDKSRVVSFPDPRDLKINGNFVYPSKLINGYLLDNRGIGPNAAFLKFSYEEYYNMDNIPTADRLFNYIIETSPFSELYQCGCRGDYQDIINDLNKLISSGELKDCKNLLR